MTCEQLIWNGAPADGQVTLTDVRPCSRGSVASRFDGDLDLYIPAYPAYPAGLGQEPEPADLGLLFQIWDNDAWHRLRDGSGQVEVTCWATKGARRR